ncbi:3-isopropylmalate dehydratase small subunit [Pseudomonas putida HB3267]|nr:3-isopropylmalate dehydratase small subunit [Pseudomonas putida HB3267]
MSKLQIRSGVETSLTSGHRANGTILQLDRANVDTDAILPKQFLMIIERSTMENPIRTAQKGL